MDRYDEENNYIIGDPHDEYLDWLLTLVNTGLRYHKLPLEYEKRSSMIKILFETRWSPLQSDDKLCYMDAIALREDFMERNDVLEDELHMVDKCTVLELLISLSVKLDEDPILSPQIGCRPGDWFVTMLKNIYLWPCEDETMDEEWSDTSIKQTLDIFVNRKYRDDGRGGNIFITNEPKHQDYTLIGLWKQACMYAINIFMREQKE